MMKPNRSDQAFVFFIIPILFVVMLAVSYFHLFDAYELETLDFRFGLRPKIPTTDKVVLIDIGEDTIKALGRWPFDRANHAFLVKALSEAGAKFIIFDIFFSEPQEHDGEFEAAVRKAGNVYLPFVLEVDSRKRFSVPTASAYIAKELERFEVVAKGMGHINIIPDQDGKYRRVPLYIKHEEIFYPYVSFLAGCDYLGIDQKDITVSPGRHISLSRGLKIPLDERSSMMINFSGMWGTTYKHYSYIDILQSYLAPLSGQKPILDLSLFKDKICIIGLTAAGTSDLHPNPFETLYPAVGIHAEVLNSILNKSFIIRASSVTNIIILIFLSLLVLFVTLNTKPIRMLQILAATVFVFTLSGVILFDLFGVWIDIFYPIVIMVLIYLSLTFYKYIGEWKRRLVMESELDIAKKIQESFLPKKLPVTMRIDISAAMFTARQVGGDLYDFVEFDSERLGVLIGDVSGKGVPASLFMAKAISEFKFFTTAESSPQDVLSNLNLRLIQETSSALFITAFYLIFDMKDMVVRYSNAGHLPVIHLSQTKKTEFLNVEEGTPLAVADSSYSGKETRFEEGDTFILYTDGVTEAMNLRSEMYGEERLASVAESHKNLSSKALLNMIEKDVRKFEPRAWQHDDMTIIVIKIT